MLTLHLGVNAVLLQLVCSPPHQSCKAKQLFRFLARPAVHCTAEFCCRQCACTRHTHPQHPSLNVVQYHHDHSVGLEAAWGCDSKPVAGHRDTRFGKCKVEKDARRYDPVVRGKYNRAASEMTGVIVLSSGRYKFV